MTRKVSFKSGTGAVKMERTLESGLRILLRKGICLRDADQHQSSYVSLQSSSLGILLLPVPSHTNAENIPRSWGTGEIPKNRFVKGADY